MGFQVYSIIAASLLALLSIASGEDDSFDENKDPRELYRILFDNQVGPSDPESVEKLLNTVQVKLGELIKTDPGAWPADDKSRLKEVKDVISFTNSYFSCKENWEYEYKTKIAFYERRSEKIKNYLLDAAVKKFKVCYDEEYEKAVQTSLEKLSKESREIGQILLNSVNKLPFPVMEVSERHAPSYLTEFADGAIQAIEHKAGRQSAKCSLFGNNGEDRSLNELYTDIVWLPSGAIYSSLRKAMIPYDIFVDQKALENIVDKSVLEWIKIFRLSRVYFNGVGSDIGKKMAELIRKRDKGSGGLFSCFNPGD